MFWSLAFLLSFPGFAKNVASNILEDCALKKLTCHRLWSVQLGNWKGYFRLGNGCCIWEGLWESMLIVNHLCNEALQCMTINFSFKILSVISIAKKIHIWLMCFRLAWISKKHHLLLYVIIYLTLTFYLLDNRYHLLTKKVLFVSENPTGYGWKASRWCRNCLCFNRKSRAWTELEVSAVPNPMKIHMYWNLRNWHTICDWSNLAYRSGCLSSARHIKMNRRQNSLAL